MQLHPVFTEFPVLESERLRLRRIVPSDAPQIYRLYSDPEVTRHYDLETFTDEHQATDLIESYSARFERGIGLRWGICLESAEDAVIGTAGYNLWLQTSYRAILGYDLAPTHWRRGFMTEALNAVLDFGFARMQLNRVEATVFPANQASHKLMRKLGFAKEGLLREYEYVKGGFVDLVLYSLLRRDRAQGKS